MTATQESILACAGLIKPRAIDVPEMGGQVYVRELTGADRDTFEADWLEWRQDENHDEKSWHGFHAFVVMFMVCDESGRPLFKNDRESVFALQKLPARLLSRLAKCALKVNGMGAEAEEEAAKNSAAGQSDGSG